MKKRIGLDIDDTICNTNFVLMKYAIEFNKEHGNKPMLKYNTNNFGEVYGWSDEEVYTFFRTYYLDALREIEPKFGVKEVLAKLREEGYEIVFITVRNDRECAGVGEARRITLEWFKKYGIPFDELHVDIYDKKTFCEENNIDIFMDDSVRTVSKVKETGIDTFIAMNDFNLDFVDDKITNIYSMEDFYNKVHALENKMVK